MRHNLNFANTRRWHPKNLDELGAITEQNLHYEQLISDMSNFMMSPEGILEGEGVSLRFTETGFLRLCKFLKIPNPFANFITWDLLRDNINRIAGEIIEKEAAFYFYENDKGDSVCVNVSTPNKVPLSHTLFVEGFKGLDLDIERITLEDNFLDLYISNPENGHIDPIEVRKGDKIKSGVRVRNSTSCFSITDARNMYWRLVCSNGMIMPVAGGHQLKLKIKPTQEAIPKIEAFMLSLNAMISELTQFPDFEDMTHTRLLTPDFAKYWKAVKRVTEDPEVTDDFIFAIDTDARKNWISQAKLVSKEEAEPEETRVNIYDVINNITEYAQRLDPIKTAKLEEIAGRIISKN